MIDEKKLIKDIAEYMGNVYECDLEDVVGFQTNNESKSAYIVQGLYEAVGIIDEQPKVGEWISCGERLPDEAGEYLVVGSDKRWICEFIKFSGVGGWANNARNPVVRAWMPLPEVYKES
jgi:hypothetical protein